MKNIACTGSKGFVGTNLVERLLMHYQIHEFNRGSKLSFKDIDCVVHLACDADSRASNDHLLKAVEDNTGIFTRVLEEAIFKNVKRFIYISSVEAETEHNVYAICKATNERLLRVMANKYDFQYVIIRPCNLYGPHMNLEDTNRNVIANFLNCIHTGKEMKIVGDPTIEKPFTYISKLIDLIEESLYTNTDQTLTVGSNFYIPIQYLPDLLEGVTKTWDWVKDQKT